MAKLTVGTGVLVGVLAVAGGVVIAGAPWPSLDPMAPAREASLEAQPLPWLSPDGVCSGRRRATDRGGDRTRWALRFAAALAAQPQPLEPDALESQSLAATSGSPAVPVVPSDTAVITKDDGRELDLPILIDGLGPTGYKISTRNEAAQAYFDQGLKLAYGFNHREAERAFRAAEKLDPRCAICAWGVALVLGPNINAPMAQEAVEPAFSAIARARALASDAEGNERALITALATRYSPDPESDRAELDKAYADAMLTLARLYPNDDDILTLAAEAVMNTQPWDYWTPERTPKGDADQVMALLETVLERNRDHIGAVHLYIHLMEAGPRASAALPYARRLGALAPTSGHLVHMPSHIYFRLGLYKDSLSANISAILADERFLAASQDQGIYRYGYYPHNVHFAMTSAQMLGDGPTAISTARKLSSLLSTRIMEEALWTQPIAAAPLLAQAQFGDADPILLTAAPPERFPLLTAHWHYARGRARLIKNDPTAARAEADAIAAIAVDPRLRELDEQFLPATAMVTIAEASLRGRIAWSEGDYEGAVGHFERAATAQDGLPYTEPPYWYYPVRQTLGAIYLDAGQLEEAEQAFRRALINVPGNGWALFGLGQTYERMGKTAVADRIFRQFDRAWAGRTPPTLKSL